MQAAVVAVVRRKALQWFAANASDAPAFVHPDQCAHTNGTNQHLQQTQAVATAAVVEEEVRTLVAAVAQQGR